MKQFLIAVVARLLRFPLRVFANAKDPSTLSARELERQGIAIYERHYYNPFITEADLRRPLDEDRDLPGIRLDAEQQLQFLRGLSGRDELSDPGRSPTSEMSFRYGNGAYDHGDADVLYAVVRSVRPRRIVEIGAGVSTKIIRAALERNRVDDADYTCRHICVEPYEQSWLDSYGVELIREKVETVDLSIFQSLEANDILFIDSSHIIRPQGDVLFEYLTVLPNLKPGVFVHVHDIFTPADYPREWVIGKKLLWNEQYLLEAFLSMNDSYEILLAGNWLANRHNAELQLLLPGFALRPKAQPGCFWIRRKIATTV